MFLNNKHNYYDNTYKFVNKVYLTLNTDIGPQ